eukprot:TRINITY_DN2557_c0_g1_i2.p1 TRINITY_DN2557_c0_g1~~TRINITY_DN2557_c0_g1_i2.p1  ORF type:complete len:289 (+),score=86.50 TRINITY_DN2557_c0_g1_i2:162-1028(+)
MALATSGPIDAANILAKAKFLSHTVDKDDDLRYDLGNLTAFDSHPIDPVAYAENAEKLIKAVGRDNLQLLFNKIFSLPTDKTDLGVLAMLPAPSTPLPREKPLPKPKAPTRWELFRQAKGIAKRKKERLVWDEVTQEWKPRYGYNRANNEADDWVIEAKPGDNPHDDPFEKRDQEKRDRVAKQKKNELKNRATSEKKEMKSLPGVVSINNAVERIDKEDYSKAIDQTRTATASIGKFTPTLPGEKVKIKEKKPDYEVDYGKEKKTTMSVLDKVLKKGDAVNMNKGNFL